MGEGTAVDVGGGGGGRKGGVWPFIHLYPCMFPFTSVWCPAASFISAFKARGALASGVPSRLNLRNEFLSSYKCVQAYI